MHSRIYAFGLLGFALTMSLATSAIAWQATDTKLFIGETSIVEKVRDTEVCRNLGVGTNACYNCCIGYGWGKLCASHCRMAAKKGPGGCVPAGAMNKAERARLKVPYC
jgi:hypothetical protein